MQIAKQLCSGLQIGKYINGTGLPRCEKLKGACLVSSVLVTRGTITAAFFFFFGVGTLKSQLWHLPADICSMPKEAGPCMALFHRWWYDKTNNSCSSFIYGGCRGNNNNFQSQAVCQSACSAKGESQGPQSLILARGGVWVLLGPYQNSCILDRPSEDQELTSHDQQVRMNLAEGGTMACWETEVGRGCGCGSKLASIRSGRGCRHGEISETNFREITGHPA